MRNSVAPLAVAAAVFFLSYTNGGFAPTTRAYAAIAAWWLIGVGAALSLGTARSQISRLALAAPALLALYALWILLSMSWAANGERAFEQFNQVSLYVAVLVLAIVLARAVTASVLAAGMALAVSAIAIIALSSRVFPSTFSDSLAGAKFLNTLYVRLSFPLGYWNGLGIEVAIGLPLLLSIMAARRSRWSALAALPLPVIAADMYLTSSRGAFVAGFVAVVVFLLLAANRWLAVAATAVAGVAFALTVYVLHSRRALLNGQMTTSLGVHQGHVVAVAVAVIAVVAALAWLGAGELARRYPVPTPPPIVGWVTTGVVVAAAIAAVVASHPIRRFQQFKKPGNYQGTTDIVTAHLLSSSGSGRWQLWTEAVSQFKAHPLNGGGAGSYLYWWLQHRPIPLYSLYAHSLYLEALGELGIVGLLLLAGAVIVAVVGAVRAALVLRSSEVAALAASGIAFFAAAAYDWIWQLAGVAVVGVGAIGLTLGALPSSRASAWSWERRGIGRPLLALLAVAAIVPQIVVLAAGLHLQRSQTADGNGDLARAKSEALAMKAVEPWAPTPYLQLGLIEAQEGHLGAAHDWFEAAIRRSRDDWQLWFYVSAVDVRRGHILEAKREIDEARRLDPRGSFFQAGAS